MVYEKVLQPIKVDEPSEDRKDKAMKCSQLFGLKVTTLTDRTIKNKEDKIQKLRANIEKQQQMFHKQRTQLDNVVKASFIVSSKLAKALKPFAEGEFIKECMLEVCGVLCPEKKNEFEKISLLRRTVRRIEMMANDIKTTLTHRMAGFESFSIALAESTDLSDTAQLAIFIRGIDKEFTVTEELLALQPLKATTTEEDIFNEVQKVLTSFGLPWSKLIGVCTDGAPSMVGLRKGFFGISNEKTTELNVQIDDLIVLHCIIHHVVVKTINFIRSRGLNHRQFKTFLDEISAEYNDVTYYCEVRWMSKGKMLKRYLKRSHKSVLIERDDIVRWRRQYLTSIKRYRSEGRPIYYLDETWLNEGHTKAKVWIDTNIKNKTQAINEGLSTGLKSPSGKGKRLIILHAGCEQGFVNDALLVFESSSNTSVCRVLKEHKENILTEPKEYSRPKPILDNINDEQKAAIRRIVHSFFLMNELPTVQKIMMAIEQHEDLPKLKKTTLKTLLHSLNFCGILLKQALDIAYDESVS
ncbi:protein FAM200A-like [Diorhabda carinulata]|uniref:protein FAM200A-like n=1 Tax=Diorhabda carinulata TaxID=1163345 RepID=UPI0025A1D133|nr:protein FAM200A-like [Diorhabda carinulata]